MHRNAARTLILFLSVLIVSLLTGCGGGHPFEFLDASYSPKGTTVAVVSGNSDDATERFAEHMTKSLKEKSTLKVLSQKEVARRLGKYPVNIASGDPQNGNWNKPIWYGSKDKGHIAAIARKLNTDYVLIMWVDSIHRTITTYSNGGRDVNYTAIVIGNLVDRHGRPIGFSNYGQNKGQSCCLFGVSEGQDIDTLLQNAADSSAEEFAQRTGTAKK